jgi:hypothetical protein
MNINIIPFQPHLSPALPTVVGNVDYHIFRQQLDRINQLLDQSDVENRFVLLSTNNWLMQNVDPAQNINIM